MTRNRQESGNITSRSTSREFACFCSNGKIAFNVSLSSAALIFSLGIAPAFSETDGKSFADGQKALKDGDNIKALDIFNAAAREHPDNADAHFGRASVLSRLGRKDEAVKEFKLTLLLNPTDDVARSCREKLSALGIKSDAAHRSSAPVATAPLTVRTHDVEDSISKILKQSEEKITDIHNGSESFASSVYNARSDAHNRAMERARQEAEEMRQAKIRFGRRLIPAFTEDQIRERQAELQYKSASALERAKSDYEARKQEAESRALGVKDTAEGLESQMINKPSETSGVFLVPNGTNLYVRNYGHFDPVMPEPPEALHAVPLKLPQVLRMQAEQAKKKDASSQKNQPANPSQ